MDQTQKQQEVRTNRTGDHETHKHSGKTTGSSMSRRSAARRRREQARRKRLLIRVAAYGGLLVCAVLFVIGLTTTISFFRGLGSGKGNVTEVQAAGLQNGQTKEIVLTIAETEESMVVTEEETKETTPAVTTAEVTTTSPETTTVPESTTVAVESTPAPAEVTTAAPEPETAAPVVTEAPTTAAAVNVGGVPSWITQQFLPVNPMSRPQIPMGNVTYIAIHYVANAGTTAKQNVSYFTNLGDPEDPVYGRQASAHFVIGLEGEILQCMPLSEMAYGINQTYNPITINIEVCHPEADGKFNEASYASLVKLSAWLMQQYGLGGDALIRHYDGTHKLCPIYYVEHPEEWDALKNTIIQYSVDHPNIN